MQRRKSNKYLKKYLRSSEKRLANRLRRLLQWFNPQQALEPEQPYDDRSNYRLLLDLRWLIQGFIYIRLKMNPRWRGKRWFLDLLDVDQVKLEGDRAELHGDIAWWAEGKAAEGEWWSSDHEPY